MSTRRPASVPGSSIEPEITDVGADALNQAASGAGGTDSAPSSESRPASHHDSVRKIDHIAIVAHDADASSQWFQETLGLQRVHDEVVQDVGARLLWLAPDNAAAGETRFQIVQPLDSEAIADYLAQKGEGLHHVCFAVDNAEEFLASRGQTGGIFTGGYGLPCAFLKATPKGIAVEIVQQERPAS